MTDSKDLALTDTLQYLRTKHAELIQRVADGKETFWLGSAVSGGRLPDLPRLFYILIERLHALAQKSEHDPCPYSDALRRLIDKAGVPGIDYQTSISGWKCQDRDYVLANLSGDYASALEISIRSDTDTRQSVSELLELHEIFSADEVPPDAEHRFLSLLVREGAAPNMITTNWDPLIERAFEETLISNESVSSLSVLAGPTDFSPPQARNQVLKIHGCACRARKNPDDYEIVVTEDQRQRWPSSPKWTPIRERLRYFVQHFPFLIVGFSAQDHNLNDPFIARSIVNLPEPERNDHVLITTTGETLGEPHQRILKSIYTSRYADDHEAIDAAATVPLYAKPLLAGLYVSVIEAKLNLAAQRSADGSLPVAGTLCHSGVRCILQLLMEFFSASDDRFAGDRTEAWRCFSVEGPRWLSRSWSGYRGLAWGENATAYRPLSQQPLGELNSEPDSVSHVEDFLAALGLFEFGSTARGWAYGAETEDETRAQITVATPVGARPVVIVRNFQAYFSLVQADLLDLDSQSSLIVIIALGDVPHMDVRSPRKSTLPGGAAATRPTFVSLERDLRRCTDEESMLNEIDWQVGMTP